MKDYFFSLIIICHFQFFPVFWKKSTQVYERSDNSYFIFQYAFLDELLRMCFCLNGNIISKVQEPITHITQPAQHKAPAFCTDVFLNGIRLQRMYDFRFPAKKILCKKAA